MSAAMPCIVCKRELHNLHGEDGNQPSGGVSFTSPGHYGSGVWDPMDGTWLDISVCDDCLNAAGDRGHVLWAQPIRQHQHATYERWGTR